VTISAEVLQEGKEEDGSSQEDQPIQGGKWSETLVQRHYAKASVGRLKEEGESLSFTAQISISVFWRPKVLLVERCDPKMDPEKTFKSKRLHIRGKRCQMAQILCKSEENENRRLLSKIVSLKRSPHSESNAT